MKKSRMKNKLDVSVPIWMIMATKHTERNMSFDWYKGVIESNGEEL
jgi:hypothetical protein